MPNPLPLEAVAEDARALVAAFRAAGGISFQDQTPQAARDTYKAACRANGLPPVPLAIVRDHKIKVSEGHILIREYRAKTGHAPALVFIHGGGWVVGDLDTHDSLCRALAAGSGRAVFAVDYRLAPEHPFPQPLQDCTAALAWLYDQAFELDLDRNKIAIAGDSAGGNLAAVLANEDDLRPQGCVFDAQVLLYPVTQTDQKTPSYAHISSGFALSASGMAWFWHHYASAISSRDPHIAPLHAQSLCQAPLFLVSCGLDPLADDSQLYAERARTQGIPLIHHHLPNHPHGIFTSAGRIPTAARLIAEAATFLRR